MAHRIWQTMAEDRVLALGNYGWGGMFDMGPSSKRAKAVESVCRRLPDDMYERFKQRMQERVWFTPSLGLGGSTKNLPADKIIYISPIWEAAPDKLVEYVVLHEMLHVIQDHQLSLNGNDPAERKMNEEQEREVDELIVRLGFQDKRAEANDFIGDVKRRLGIAP
jgi:hypothetical protein